MITDYLEQSKHICSAFLSDFPEWLKSVLEH